MEFNWADFTKNNGHVPYMPMQGPVPTYRFFRDAVKNEARSAKEDAPRYDDVHYVEVRAAGFQDSVVHKITEQLLSRPDHPYMRPLYERWKAGEEDPVEGMPIEQWSVLSPAQVAELRAQGIRTVEQIRGLPDAALPKIGLYGRSIRDKAEDFLRAFKDQSGIAQMEKRMATLENENILLKEQLAELSTKKKKAKYLEDNE